MPQVTYNGERPVVTPTLASEGNTDLGLWEPGQTKDVPEALIDGLTGEGSAFSAAGTPDQSAEQEQKPSGGGGIVKRS